MVNRSKKGVYLNVEDFRELIEEGFLPFDTALELIELIQGNKFNSDGEPSSEFNIAHGIGTYDDVYRLLKGAQIDLFPIGIWSQYTLYIGSDENIYITDFNRIARIRGGIKNGIDKLIFENPLEDAEFIKSD